MLPEVDLIDKDELDVLFTNMQELRKNRLQQSVMARENRLEATRVSIGQKSYLIRNTFKEGQ